MKTRITRKAFIQKVSMTLLIILIIHYVNLVAFPQINKSEVNPKKEVGKLYDQREYDKAIAILEKLIINNPSDPEINYGLGYLLFLKAVSSEDENKQRELGRNAKTYLFKAKELGAEDENLNEIVNAFINKDGSKLGQLYLLLSLHPPKIFENDPPEGVKLPDGYHHKGGGDFEGNHGGKIWKRGELEITYSFSVMEESEITQDEKDKFIQYKELSDGERIITFGITKENEFIGIVKSNISIKYSSKIKENKDIATILSIIFPK
jgi:hypothetical protein